MAEKEGVVEETLEADELDGETDEGGIEEDSDGDAAVEIDELEQARLEAEEAKDKLLRLAADFENYKRRMERDRGLSLKYAEERILKELLPSIDNLERAIEQGRKTDNAEDLLAGVELTYKGMVSSLEKFELIPMESIGEPFDPNYHEALAMEETDDVDPNHVLREFEKGYMFKDKLIRPAKVVVSKK